MAHYICEGTIVRTTGREGHVIGVDYNSKIVVVSTGKSFFTVTLDMIESVSYKGGYLIAW